MTYKTSTHLGKLNVKFNYLGTHQFDLFCTSTPVLRHFCNSRFGGKVELIRTRLFSFYRLTGWRLSPKLRNLWYAAVRPFTSAKTLLRPKLHFGQNFTSTKTLLRWKLYIDQNLTSTSASQPLTNPNLKKRSK